MIGSSMRSLLLLLFSGCVTVAAIPDRPPGQLVAFTNTEAAVPLVITDTTHECQSDERRHIELVDVASGQVRWRAEGWQAVVGRLADGALLVSSEGTYRSTALELGVLDLFDGRLLGRCAVSTPTVAGDVTWQQPAPGLLRGSVHGKHLPTDVPAPVEPPFGVEARFGRWGCEITQLSAPPVVGTAVPSMAVWNLRLGDVTFHVPKTPPPSIVAKRGDQILWRKQVGVVGERCLVP